MAEQETTVPIEDTGMLSSIMAETPDTTPEPASPEPEPEPQVREDESGRLRGADGKFVAKPTDTPAAATQQPAEQQPPTNDDIAAQVPSWRLREVREAREAAERRAEEASRQAYAFQQQMAEMQRQLAELRQPKQQPVDFFENPDAALQQRLSPIEERFNQLQSRLMLNSSRAMAVAMHGADAVKEMETAVDKASREGHPEMTLLAAQMRASDDPVQVAMQWHQRTKLQSEVGNDLNAYKAKLKEQLLSDQEFLAAAVAKATGQAQQAAAQPGTRPNISLPPSLNKATGAGLTNSDPNEPADLSDRSLFRHAMGNRR
jgi:hypothetical protein